MAMAWVWTGMVVCSLIFGTVSGNLGAVANAALEGADSAIQLSLSMAEFCASGAVLWKS